MRNTDSQYNCNDDFFILDAPVNTCGLNLEYFCLHDLALPLVLTALLLSHKQELTSVTSQR